MPCSQLPCFLLSSFVESITSTLQATPEEDRRRLWEILESLDETPLGTALMEALEATFAADDAELHRRVATALQGASHA